MGWKMANVEAWRVGKPNLPLGWQAFPSIIWHAKKTSPVLPVKAQ